MVGGCLQAADSTFLFKTSDNVLLYVNVSGKGKPCVFVHGGPGSNADYFQAFQKGGSLEEQVQMVYFDQRGCGRSSSPENGDFTLARMEKDLEELRQHLGFKNWAVMGHSFGGIIITHYAKDYPTSVAALLLINCTLDMEQSLNSHIRFGLQELNISDTAPYLDKSKPTIERVGMIHEKFNEKGIWYKLMFRNKYEKIINDSLFDALGKQNRDFASAVWGVPEYQQSCLPLTRDIKMPVFIMSGRKDYAIGPDQYKSFDFPDKKVVLYNGGHAPFQEEPQWFSEKVTDFFMTIGY